MRKLEDFTIITLTHREAHMQQIGKFVLSGTPEDDAVRLRLASLRNAFDVEEILYLATCNRVLFGFIHSRPMHRSSLAKFFQKINPELQPEDLQFITEKALLLHGMDAVTHLYEVASSINSLVVGEREILRQLRTAFEQCLDAGLAGKNISLIMRYAVEAAKAVYSRTQIGEKPVSVVSLAIQQLLALQVPTTAKILFVGAGQTNHLVAKLLKNYDYHNFTVFNRTLTRAEEFTQAHGGEALAMEELSSYDKGFDVLVVCTAATAPIVTPELYSKILGNDTAQKVVIDLSIPYNVSPEITQSHQVELIEIEGLRQLAEQNLSFRQNEVHHAIEIIREYLLSYEEDQRSRFILSALSVLPDQVKEVKDKAIGKVFRKELDLLDPQAKELLLRMMDYMEKGFATLPVKAVKSALK